MRYNYFKKAFIYLGFSVAVVTTSCNSSQQLIDPKLSLKTPPAQKTGFMEDVTLQGQRKKITISNTNAAFASKTEISPNIISALQSKYAGLLGVFPQAISNFSLYSFIEDWYGVRYRLGGNDKTGIDCSAFVQRLYENVFCTNLLRTAVEQFKNCHMIWNTDSLEEGDLVFFHIHGRKRISHVGIYLANNYFVHASSTQGVMISNLNDRYWARFYAGAGKIREEQNTSF